MSQLAVLENKYELDTAELMDANGGIVIGSAFIIGGIWVTVKAIKAGSLVKTSGGIFSIIGGVIRVAQSQR